MMGKTHIAAGVILAELSATNLLPVNTEYKIALSLGIILGSVFPDVDEPRSTIGKKLAFVSIPYRILGMIFSFIGSLIPVKNNIFSRIGTALKHRHFTHSLSHIIIWGLIALVLYISKELILSCFSLGIIGGIVIHIALDRLNKWIPINSIFEYIFRYSLYVLIIFIAVNLGRIGG